VRASHPGLEVPKNLSIVFVADQQSVVSERDADSRRGQLRAASKHRDEPFVTSSLPHTIAVATT
jgi:hypothetical protein